MQPTAAEGRPLSLRWATGLAAGALALTIGLLQWSNGDRATGEAAAAVARPRPATTSNGVRIIYPAGRSPALLLPDGTRRPITSLLNVDRTLHYGDYVWNDSGIPAASLWVRIDLKNQTMSVFRGGNEIGATVILYGTDGKPTPTGTFPILEKAQRHRSTLYDAEMPYMLRLTGDGVAVHASNVHKGAATHGCIGIPEPFAKLLFGAVERGDKVVIT
jgi:lipoprotein-anchoring transpeptidase ErfK/SrfK